MKEIKRYIGEMSNMYGIPTELYTMRRAVKEKGELVYDITIIPPYIINGQNNKTKGHIHSSGHNEEYIVLDGTAIFFFQKMEGKVSKKVQECKAVLAKKGDHVIIPSDCYHITINSGKKTLKLANWVNKKCVSDYKLIEDMDGMCYYYCNRKWVNNPKYKTHPVIKFC